MDLSNFTKFDFYLKFLIIGDSGVGKTSLFLNFIKDTFCEKTQTTIGVDFRNKIIEIDGKIVKIQVWDTAGQEMYRSLSKSFYKIANGVILVFDLTNEESFDNLKHWISELNEFCLENINIILVGNKIDLVDQRKISFLTANNFAIKNNLTYYEISNKIPINIDNVFLGLTNHILNKNNDNLSTQEEINHDEKSKSLFGQIQTKENSNCC